MLPYGYANTQQLPYPGQPSYPQNPAALQQTNGEAQMQAVRKRKEHELGPDGKPKDRRFDHCNLVLEATGRRGALYIGDILSSVIPEILEPANIRAILSVGHDAGSSSLIQLGIRRTRPTERSRPTNQYCARTCRVTT